MCKAGRALPVNGALTVPIFTTMQEEYDKDPLMIVFTKLCAPRLALPCPPSRALQLPPLLGRWYGPDRARLAVHAEAGSISVSA